MISSLVLSACSTIPNIKFYKEIPFIDAPEAIYVESVTRKRGMLSAEEYAKKRPYFLMLDPEGVQQIKLNWKRQCRRAEDECNVQLETVGTLIDQLNQMTEEMLKGR